MVKLHSGGIAWVILFLFSGQVEAVTLSPGSDKVMLLEQFTSNPGIISNVVYSIKLTGLLKVSTTNSQERFFRASWQTNAFFLQETPTLDVEPRNTVMDLSTLSGHFESNYWTFPRKDTLFVRTYSGVAPDMHSGSVIGLVASAENDLSQVLNFGIFGIPVGSLNWSNHEFSVASKLNNSVLAGRLKIGLRNQPEGLEFTSTTTTEDSTVSKAKYFVNFSYDDIASPSGLPVRISRYLEHEGTNVLIVELTLYSLTQVKELLQKEHFSPSRFMSNGMARTMIYTNNALYTWDQSGQFVRISNIDSHSIAVSKQLRKKWHVYTLMLGATISFAFILLVEGRKRKINQKTKIN